MLNPFKYPKPGDSGCEETDHGFTLTQNSHNRPDYFGLLIHLLHIRNPELGLSTRITVDNNTDQERFIQINLPEME